MADPGPDGRLGGVLSDSAPSLFDELPDDIRAGIADLGWGEPMPVQEQVIPLMRRGVDVMVQARTGSGKTGAFSIPIVAETDQTPEGSYPTIPGWRNWDPLWLRLTKRGNWCECSYSLDGDEFKPVEEVPYAKRLSPAEKKEPVETPMTTDWSGAI